MALNKKAMRRAVIAASSAALLVLTACGSDDGGSDTGSDTGAAASDEGRGPITIVEGQDPLNAALENIIADWNAENPDEQVTFKPLAREANDQYADIAQRMQAQSDEYDLVAVDVTNTAEFAANGWLLPLEGDNAIDTDGLLPATVESGTYNGTLYAAPKNTNGAFLYYRTDLVDQAPATWDELKAECPKAEEAGIACYIGQFSNYEGLTVNVTEIVNAFGGSFVAEDGLTPAIDEQTAEGLQFIVDSFEDGTIPAAAQTYTEGESQTAFGNGEACSCVRGPVSTPTVKRRRSPATTASRCSRASTVRACPPSAATTSASARSRTLRRRLATSSSSCRPVSRRSTTPRSVAHRSSPRSTTTRRSSSSTRTSRH